MKCGQWKNNGAKIGPCFTQFLTIGIQINQETKYFMDWKYLLKILMAWNVAN